MIIEEFNLSTVKAYSNYMIIGSKSSGKTTVIRDLIDTNRHLFNSTGTYVTRLNEKDKHIMDSNIGSDKLVYLNNPFTFMDTVTTESLRVLVNDSNNTHIAFDNILLPTSWLNEVVVKELIQVGKTKKNSSILSFDTVPKLSQEDMKHIDYIFLSNNLDFEDIYEFYNSCVTGFSFTEFVSIYQLLDSYDFIAIDNKSNTYYIYNSIDDSLHHFSYRHLLLPSMLNRVTDDDILSGKINIGVDI